MRQVLVFIDPDKFGPNILGNKDVLAALGFNRFENSKIFLVDVGSLRYAEYGEQFSTKAMVILIPDAMTKFDFSPDGEFKVLRHGNTPDQTFNRHIWRDNCIGFAQGTEIGDDPYFSKVAQFVGNCHYNKIEDAQKSFDGLWERVTARSVSKEQAILEFLEHCSSFDAAKRLYGQQGHVGNDGVKFVFDSTVHGQQVSSLVEAVVRDGEFNDSAYDILTRRLGDL